MDLKINEKFKNIIPALSDNEYLQLENNILQDGIREPLVTWNGYLIDGHNRYSIATKYGLAFETTEKEFDSEADAERWIILNQFGRRNISAYDRSVLALKLKPIIAEKAKEKETERKSTFQKSEKSFMQPINTTKELARIAKVSHDTIAKVEKIEQQASPEIKKQVKAGDISINQAYQAVKREEKARQQETRREENAEKIEKLSSPLEAQGLF